MLFGQWQTRRRRKTLLSIDDLLSEFENVKGSDVHGFAVNPLSSVEFPSVFEGLGYETKPPKGFGFTKRNIHFAAACRQTAKQRLCCDLQRIMGPALPNEEGMVRISSSPPTSQNQNELRYEERYWDVPAARTREDHTPVVQPAGQSRCNGNSSTSIESNPVPLVVALDKPFSASGQGLVSHRTAEHVGFNGIEFRHSNGYPEMRNDSSRLVGQAWPRSILQRYSTSESEEPVYGVESVKCAPENWVVRRPVGHFGTCEQDWKARYPPRNLLNAKFGQGPRVEHPWVPTKTYNEPPFPIMKGRAAETAMKKVAMAHSDITKPFNVLQLLRAVFECMNDREQVRDPWLQRRATIPSREALLQYQNQLQTYIQRGTEEPSGVMTLRQAFKKDAEIANQATRILQERGESVSNKVLRSAVIAKLFAEASSKPGGLDRFLHAVERDHERYAEELKVFKETVKQFDREHGLLPVEDESEQPLNMIHSNGTEEGA